MTTFALSLFLGFLALVAPRALRRTRRRVFAWTVASVTASAALVASIANDVARDLLRPIPPEVRPIGDPGIRIPEPPPGVEVRIAGFGEGREDRPVPCPPALEVLSAMHVAEHPDLSLAAVRLAGETSVVQRGDVIADAPVEGVRVDGAGVAELLLRVDGTLVACRPAAHREAAAPEITPASDGRPAIVSRPLVEAIVRGDRTDAWRGVRIVPAFTRAGEPIGFTVLGIAEGSLVSALGLRNGDVIRAVNGTELRTPGAVFAAYARWKDAREFAIAIRREERDETVRVEVR